MESRRERKKRQTRQLLVETALRLFAEQGYEQTTVAQIAAAADVSTKTFFNYFPTKDDVLFAETRERNEAPLALIAGRRPGESVPDLLARVYETMIADYLADADGAFRDPAVMRTYVDIVTTTPSLQAKGLHEVFALQRRVADALVAAYPDELDPVSAAAIVGSVVGATQAAALVSLARGDGEQEVWAAMRRGIEVALRGLDAYRA
ncbi:TetR family transcriptional regulator [Pseudonocardia sp. CNS-139]|nr:TetR family transcriptional regulator [Pseudonocardia sp. CNS-139]